MTEYYNSSTLGRIPLSFTGRRLMQNLREAFKEYSTKCRDSGGYDLLPNAWEPVSRARGELAQYISKLERGRYTPECEAFDKVANYSGKPNEQPAQTVIYNLPNIPPGYVLRMVGNISTIEPLEQVKLVDIELKQKQLKDLNELLDELHKVCFISGENFKIFNMAENSQHSYRINKIKAEIVKAYESKST